MTLAEFQADIRAGIPDRLPAAKPYAEIEARR
jgi:hypothetical protein